MIASLLSGSVWKVAGLAVIGFAVAFLWQRGSLYEARAERAEAQAAAYAAQAAQERRRAAAADEGIRQAQLAARRAQRASHAARRELNALDRDAPPDDPCRALLDAHICPAVADWLREHDGVGRAAPGNAPGIAPDAPTAAAPAPGG